MINNQKTAQPAIDRLTAVTGWKAEQKGNKLLLTAEGHLYTWVLLIRKGLRNMHLPAIEKELAGKQPTLLVTDHLLPGLRERLRVDGISYLDETGNIFLKRKDLLILVEAGGREKQDKQVKAGSRAFTKTGLPLVFAILQNPELLTKTRRELAAIYGMAVGNVHNVLEALQDEGYLVASGTTRKKQYRLVNKKKLLDVWIKGYGEELKPALLLGSFRFFPEVRLDSWKKLTLNKDRTVWGGEPASELLTHYLTPGELTIYTEEAIRNLILSNRLIPDKAGPIKIYAKFWHYEEEGMTGVAPALLVYADLLLTGNARCAETAEMIYDEYLKKEF